MEAEQIEASAARLLAAFDHAAPVEPLTAAYPSLSSVDAYRIAAEILRLRAARGETPVGWKIGFTNRTIWDEYDVHAPIWGPMYASTTGVLEGGDWRVSHLREPRIEAEVAFRIARTPRAGADEASLLSCIDAVCHGLEIVQSPFPGWRFRPVDTMAAGALHGSFVHGPWTRLEAADHPFWLTALRGFSLTVRGGADVLDKGHARNVLDGPLSALHHFVDGLAAQPHGRAIRAGDIVTTGTVARAFPVEPGEHWSTEFEGLPLTGLAIRCT